MTATLDVQIPEAFADLRTPARYKVYHGGRGAAKSRTFARMLILRSYERTTRVLCTRELQTSIEDSVHRLLTDTIKELGLDEFFDITRSTITGLNGSLFLFEGLRFNTKQIKSTEGVDICWVEEADAVSNDSWDLLIPTIRKEGSEIWISFNPDSPDDPTYRRFVTDPPPGAIVRKVGWEDNPWLPQVLRDEMAYCQAHDPEKYAHVWGGEPSVNTEARVFHGKYVVRDFDVPAGVTFYCGADWGFSNDPDVVVRLFIADDCLFVDAESYGRGVEITETPALFDAVLPHKAWPCRADSARPELISHMRNLGYNIIAADKEKGSVEDGIRHMRGYREIVVRPRCKHHIEELQKYSYKTDRLTGDVLPILVDAWNHCIDADRYALSPIRRHARVPHVAYVGGN